MKEAYKKKQKKYAGRGKREKCADIIYIYIYCVWQLNGAKCRRQPYRLLPDVVQVIVDRNISKYLKNENHRQQEPLSQSWLSKQELDSKNRRRRKEKSPS